MTIPVERQHSLYLSCFPLIHLKVPCQTFSQLQLRRFPLPETAGRGKAVSRCVSTHTNSQHDCGCVCVFGLVSGWVSLCLTVSQTATGLIGRGGAGAPTSRLGQRVNTHTIQQGYSNFFIKGPVVNFIQGHWSKPLPALPVGKRRPCIHTHIQYIHTVWWLELVGEMALFVCSQCFEPRQKRH